MRIFLKKIIQPFLSLFAKVYFSKPRKFNYKSVKGIILPGVFHPQFTISTKLLMDYIEPLNLSGKPFLELGSGSGIISVLAAQKGALVTSSDINLNAIKNTELNAERNQVQLQSITSDLFNSIPQQHFDYIVINPPYYPKTPKNDVERAWFCGESFEYFEQLFNSIGDYFSINSTVLMILSIDCELVQIKNIAQHNGFRLDLAETKTKMGEENYIFKLLKSI